MCVHVGRGGENTVWLVIKAKGVSLTGSLRLSDYTCESQWPSIVISG